MARDAGTKGRVRGYIASSIDGFIAGVDDDLSWLPDDVPEPDEGSGVVDYASFTADVGALLMGRRSFDVVHGMDVPWPYTDPVCVATHRPLPDDAPEGVIPVAGTIDELVDRALEVAAGRDVYVDGGDLLRQVLAAGRLDEIVITYISKVLGAGVPLFAGGAAAELRVVSAVPYGDSMAQLTLVPAR